MSETTGIGIGVVTTLSVLALLGFGVAAFTGRLSGASGFITPFLFAIANFIPFGLIVFGFIADMIGQEFRYSIASIVGIISIFINNGVGRIADMFFKTPSDTGLSSVVDTGKMWCFIPGLEGLESKSLPMNFTVMGSVMTYYLIFGLLNRNMSMNTSLISAFFIFPIVQGLAFYTGGCSQWYSGGALGNIIAWILGIALGGIAYSIVNAADPSRSPFAFVWKGDSVTPNNSPASGWQSSAPRSGGKCTAADTDDNNAFVCEAYKNGVLVTEKIS